MNQADALEGKPSCHRPNVQDKVRLAVEVRTIFQPSQVDELRLAGGT